MGTALVLPPQLPDAPNQPIVAEFQEESSRKQQTLLERVENLEKLVRNFMQAQKQGSGYSTEQTWNWPIKNETDLQSAEIWLQDQSRYKREVSSLSRIGGTTVTKCIYNTLHWMISHEFALTLRMTSKSGKIPFADKLIGQLIRDAFNWGMLMRNHKILRNH